MEGTGESQSRSSSSSSLLPPFIGLGTTPMTPPPPEEGGKGKGKGKGKRRKLPSAKEMVAHYESQGMETQEASLKVIEDLQKLLFKVVTTKNKNNNNNNANNVDLNVVHSRLLFLESKLDSKPGYPQTLAIGVASGAAVRLFPHLAASVANIWNSVRASNSPWPWP